MKTEKSKMDRSLPIIEIKLRNVTLTVTLQIFTAGSQSLAVLRVPLLFGSDGHRQQNYTLYSLTLRSTI